jgi:uncharacterized RDD family membrane protein YckC
MTENISLFIACVITLIAAIAVFWLAGQIVSRTMKWFTKRKK